MGAVLAWAAPWVSGAEPAASPLQIGVDLKSDLARARNAGTWTSTSLDGYALVHLNWEPAHAESEASAWRGYASILGLAGRGPTAKYLYDFLAADNIEGFTSIRLYSWWLERNQGAWSLRAGALLADEEFNGTESGGHFLNSSFGWPAFISANTVNTGPAFFVAAPGARLRWTPSDASSWQLGIYDGDTFDSAEGDPAINRHGWHYQLGGRQGWFVIAETTWRPADNSPTRVKLGAWVHTADFADVYRDASGQPLATTGLPARLHSGNRGYYAVLERTLQGKRGEPGGIDSHLRFGTAPADRNALSWVVDGGFSWRGPLPSRPKDALSLGYTYAHFSGDYAANARLAQPNEAPPDYEHVLEATYEYLCGPNVVIQPDIQWIGHTGGTASVAQSLLFNIRLNISY